MLAIFYVNIVAKIDEDYDRNGLNLIFTTFMGLKNPVEMSIENLVRIKAKISYQLGKCKMMH